MERMTAAELMALEVGERQFAVDDLIPLGSVTMVYAKKARNKSVFTMVMSDRTSRGAIFLGRRTRQGQVLYIGSEDDQIELHSRYGRLARSYGEEPSTELDLVDTWPKQQEGGIEAVAEWCESCDNPVMVVVDIIAKIEPGFTVVRKGWSGAMKLLDPWIKLARDQNIAVVLVGHMPGNAPDYVDNPISRVQGSGGFAAYAQTVLCIQGEAKVPERQLDYEGKFGHGKLALTIGAAAMTCELRDVDPEQQKDDTRSDVRQRILNLVRMFPGLKAREYARMMPERSVAATERMLDLMARDEELVRRAIGQETSPRRYFAPEAAATAPLHSASEEERTA